MCRRNAIFHSFVIGSSECEPFFFARLYYLFFCALRKPSTAAVRQMDLWATKLFVGRTGTNLAEHRNFIAK